MWATESEGDILRLSASSTTSDSYSLDGADDLVEVHDPWRVYGTGDKVWVVGEIGVAGGIWQSVDSGQTWNLAKRTETRLYGVHGNVDGRPHSGCGGRGARSLSQLMAGTLGWPPIPDGKEANLYGVFVAEDGRAWAVGSRETILMSERGTTNWEVQRRLPPSVLNPKVVYGTAEGRTLWAVGDTEIWSSADYGRIWDIQLSYDSVNPEPNAYHFIARRREACMRSAPTEYRCTRGTAGYLCGRRRGLSCTLSMASRSRDRCSPLARLARS